MDVAYERFFKPPRAHDRHELLVTHANNIRYFVCRAMAAPIAKLQQISLT